MSLGRSLTKPYKHMMRSILALPVTRKAVTVALWIPAISVIIIEAGIMAVNVGAIVAVIGLGKRLFTLTKSHE